MIKNNILSISDKQCDKLERINALGIKYDKYYVSHTTDDPNAILVDGFNLNNIKLLLFNKRMTKETLLEFINVREQCNTKYFILENTNHNKSMELVICMTLGVEPILINNKPYWTNINIVDKCITTIDDLLGCMITKKNKYALYFR